MSERGWASRHTRNLRIVVMFAALVVVATAVGAAGYWRYAATAGWAAACLVYVVWVWAIVGRMDAATTRTHANREDPKRLLRDVLLVVASIASLFSLVYVLVQAKSAPGAEQEVVAGLAVTSVVLSWVLVHTLFTLRYGQLYYSRAHGGIDFNQDDDPQYTDFAYLAFTVGMTYQVSDTSVSDGRIRATMLRHALLSYLFGSVIIASFVNFIVSLAG
ncbi:DUF1345 domain-containing protein [Frigoribacterium sp. 2-23]|uniref:DUF1345 domain-containing protein n=1 Tax=Frigoribacterium sp. 2-23 TaxID=3415006 RepID=UPI003C6EAD91